MHIPDGLMAPAVLALGWLLALPFLMLANRKMEHAVNEENIPLMGVLAAGIFVAQMVNFPIGAGASGHLLGGVLAAVLLGPVAAIVVITCILVIQCLLFGDGGIVALGLNILNMAIIGVLVGWVVYTRLPVKEERIRIFAASWASVFIASLACAIQLSISYWLTGGEFGVDASIALPFMLGYHAVIGIGEGVITTGVVAYLATVSPEMMKLRKLELFPSDPVGVVD
jgi:cobalt/nickel transport system permease protein